MNTEKHYDFYRKYKWFIWFTVVLALLFFAIIQKRILIKNYPRYAVGITKEAILSKGIKKETKYEFFIDEKQFKGTYVEFSFNAKDIVIPDGKYLIVYSTYDPRFSYFLVDKPVLETVNIDSLNLIGVDERDISWR